MTKLMTVQKWGKEYQIELKWVTLPGSKIRNVQCIICKEYEAQIMSSKKFSDSWIKGSKNPTSDAVKKHVTSERHKRAADLALKKELSPKEYVENNCWNTVI